ncbi:hypothetical protein DFJ58DRAFT_848398, partial [Suillus subalutaceus]|uniref:uncharacterized protein n=1 Tax=Suillus subalutaceus TaxID=48586 RepID=UPI001B8824EC
MHLPSIDSFLEGWTDQGVHTQPTPVVPVRRSPSPKNGYQNAPIAALPPSVPSYRFTYNERTAPDAWPAQHDPDLTASPLTDAVNSISSAACKRECNCDPSDQIEIPQTIKVLIPHTRKKKALCYQVTQPSTASWNYAKEDIMVLTDEPYNLRYMPTKRNILAHYGDSGHGGRIIDLDGPRVMATVHPSVDWEHAGEIVTEDLYDAMASTDNADCQTLTAGCRLIALL